MLERRAFLDTAARLSGHGEPTRPDVMTGDAAIQWMASRGG